MTHHPHLHMIVPGGGLSPDGTRWVSSRPAFLLPVRVLGMLFRRLFLEGSPPSTRPGRLAFFGTLAPLSDASAFVRALAPVRRKRWVVYAKPPFAGPEGRARLSVALHPPRRHLQPAHRRLRRGERQLPRQGLPPRRGRAARVMTLSATEFIRRFLLHVLPRGFHRIRHYGFLAGSNRKAGLAHIRTILGTPAAAAIHRPEPDTRDAATDVRPPCPRCGGPMTIVGSFAGWHQPRGPPFRPAPNRACTP